MARREGSWVVALVPWCFLVLYAFGHPFRPRSFPDTQHFVAAFVYLVFGSALSLANLRTPKPVFRWNGAILALCYGLLAAVVACAVPYWAFDLPYGTTERWITPVRLIVFIAWLMTIPSIYRLARRDQAASIAMKRSDRVCAAADRAWLTWLGGVVAAGCVALAAWPFWPVICLLIPATVVVCTPLLLFRTHYRVPASATLLALFAFLWAVSLVRPLELNYVSPIGFLAIDFERGAVSWHAIAGRVDHMLITQHLWHGAWGENLLSPRWAIGPVLGRWNYPLWPPVVLMAWVTFRLPRLGPVAGGCMTCGYDLTGNTSGVCPECGKSIERAVE